MYVLVGEERFPVTAGDFSSDPVLVYYTSGPLTREAALRRGDLPRISPSRRLVAVNRHTGRRSPIIDSSVTADGALHLVLPHDTLG